MTSFGKNNQFRFSFGKIICRKCKGEADLLKKGNLIINVKCGFCEALENELAYYNRVGAE